MKYTKKFFYLLLINLLFAPFWAMALSIDLSGANPIKQTSIIGLIRALVDVIITLGTVVVVFFVIYSGFQFVTAQGEESKITKAKESFFWSVIGGVVLLGARVLSDVICNTASSLGANISC